MTATSPRAVRVGATARTRTGRDLSDRSRAGAVGHQRASKAATRPRRHLGRAALMLLLLLLTAQLHFFQKHILKTANGWDFERMVVRP